MKTLFTRSTCIIYVILFGLITTFNANAQQLSGTYLETGGLYTALAKDASNNLYVTRVQAGTSGMSYEVVKYIKATGTPVSIYSGLTSEAGDYPWGLVVTNTGNVYISTDFSANGGSIIKLTYDKTANTYTPSTFQTGNYYSALAIDGSNNLYTAEYDAAHNTYAVVEYGSKSAALAPGTQLYDNLKTAPGYAYPTGLTVATNGDVYVADAFNNGPGTADGGKVIKLTKASAYAASTVSTGMYSSSLTLDPSGNLYSTENSGTGYKLVEYVNGTGTGNVVFSPLHSNGIYYPWGIAFYSASSIYVADGDDGTNGGELVHIAPSPPTTITNAATFVTIYAATLNGHVNDNGYVTTVNFTYGTSPTLAGATTVVATKGGTIAAGTGNTATSVSINKLAASTTYYYQVSATDVGGTTTGSILSFTTPTPAVISYLSPLTYTVGLAIEPVSPTNTGTPMPGTIYGQVVPFAGNGAPGNTNGTGTDASFHGPYGTATDASGNVYVADGTNNLIRKITPGGVVTTFAGSGAAGAANGTGTAASFHNPYGVAVDAAGNVYVADAANNLIRKITPAGVVSTFAGNTAAGSVNGTGPAARFNKPHGVAVDNANNVYVADFGNNLVRVISPLRVVTTLAGSGTAGATNGTGTAASFSSPYGLSVDAAGNVYVADQGNNLIRMIAPGGVVTTFAGSGTAGSADGSGTAASFNSPFGTAVDPAGNIYVADGANDAIRKISQAGLVTTLAGGAPPGSANGVGTAAKFNNPHGVAVDASGNIFVADAGNDLIRQLSSTGYTFNNVLPDGLVFDSATGTLSGTPTTKSVARNYNISSYNAIGKYTAVVNITIANPPTAPNITYGNPRIYTSGVIITPLKPGNSGGAVPTSIYGQTSVFAGTGSGGNANGTGTGASFSTPYSTAIDTAGNIYVADAFNDLIRKITPAGVVTTLAGSGTPGSANGLGTAASFSTPIGVTVDPGGNVFVTDEGNNLIRKITPDGTVSTFAGSGTVGFANGVGTAASFNNPWDIAADQLGNLYVTDSGNNLIREITPNGTVSTYAGSGTAGSSNGTGTAASFNLPYGIAVDASGNVYVGDAGNYLIRKITPGGAVTTFAGSGSSGFTDGTGTAASFTQAFGLGVDALENVYVGDTYNNAIRKITPAGVVTTLAGGTQGNSNGIGTAASFYYPLGICVDKLGNLYIAEYGNFQVREVSSVGFSGITPTLPTGLSYDATTGTISGTPSGLSPATNYTVTAYNEGGSSTAIANITVQSSNPNAIANTNSDLLAEPVVKQAMSPNGDGLNDKLSIENIEKYPYNTVMLTNAKGIKVYEISGYDNINKVFDGHSNVNGELQKPGTYYYLLQYRSNNTMQRKTGYFVIKY